MILKRSCMRMTIGRIRWKMSLIWSDNWKRWHLSNVRPDMVFIILSFCHTIPSVTRLKISKRNYHREFTRARLSLRRQFERLEPRTFRRIKQNTRGEACQQMQTPSLGLKIPHNHSNVMQNWKRRAKKHLLLAPTLQRKQWSRKLEQNPAIPQREKGTKRSTYR